MKKNVQGTQRRHYILVEALFIASLIAICMVTILLSTTQLDLFLWLLAGVGVVAIILRVMMIVIEKSMRKSYATERQNTR